MGDILSRPKSGSRGQREEGETSKTPLRVPEAEGESYLEPAAGQDQGPGAVAVTAISDQSVAPLQPGEAERGSQDARRVAGEESEIRAAAPGVPAGAARGGLEPRVGGDPLGGPQPCGREGQPATGEGRAIAPPRGRQSSAEEGRGRSSLRRGSH